MSGDERAMPGETTSADASSEKKRRRSRWGPSTDADGNAQDAAHASQTVVAAAPASTQPPVENVDSAEKKKRRRSRWETNGEDDTNGSNAGALVAVDQPAMVARAAATATALTQMPVNGMVVGTGIFVQLPTSLLAEHSAPADATPEVHFMFRELAQLNRRLIAGLPYDDRPARERSPEPAPVYDANGVRVNTREIVEREKFQTRRMEILEEICRKCPTFRPPPDYKPNKRFSKLPIPVDEYPGYNFFGLIIGPRGSTQKQMQRDTNTKIVIRGKGSARGGTAAADRHNERDDEPLHVYIEGDVQEDVDKATAIIKKLLIPVDEDMNEHKRTQLRELALMNGTLRDETSIEAMQKRLDEEMASGGIYQLPETLKKAVAATYKKDIEALHGPGTGGTLDSAYSDFLSELGVSGKAARRNDDENDDCKIYVGRLPPTATSEALEEIFKPFGTIESVACIPDQAQGYSCKGFAFITFSSPKEAAAAQDAMNGGAFEDRTMEVRVKSAPREERRENNTFNEDANLYVSGIPDSMTDEHLRELFSPYGLVQRTKIIRDHNTQMPKGYGFVQMMDPSHAQAAMAALSGQYFEGSMKPFLVRIAGQKNDNAAPGAMYPSASGFAMPQPGVAPYGAFPPVMYGAMPTDYAASMMGFAPDVAAYYGGAAAYAGADMYGSGSGMYAGGQLGVELGNPDEAPPPPPDEDGAPPIPAIPPMMSNVVAPGVVAPEDIAVLPGVAPPAPPPMPPPPS